MTTIRLAVIPGDGVGREVVPVGLDALRRVGAVTGSFDIKATELDWSCERYLATGRCMPADGLAILEQHDATYFGAVGHVDVPDHVSLWELLIPIRQGLDLYVNLRPVRVLEGIASPLRNGTPATVDMLCIRENTEGEYTDIGGRFHRGGPDESAVQTSVYTRKGTERIVRYAFDRARERKKTLASATKSNAITYTAVMWDEIVREVAREYPDVTVTSYLIDALSARFVYAPESLDVVVASNLYGDILTDIGAALQGSLGLAGSANLDPERRHPSLFEPVHGSAPTIAGKGIVNPMAAVWAACLMLDHLGLGEASRLLMRALESVARLGPHTADIGGRASTREVGAAIVAAIGR
jgi:tartrate dehydrogenase/decarboxylase/D-malate dehydrogenase